MAHKLLIPKGTVIPMQDPKTAQDRIIREPGKRMGCRQDWAVGALILHARGDLDGAMALHKEKERICRRELGNKKGLPWILREIEQAYERIRVNKVSP